MFSFPSIAPLQVLLVVVFSRAKLAQSVDEGDDDAVDNANEDCSCSEDDDRASQSAAAAPGVFRLDFKHCGDGVVLEVNATSGSLPQERLSVAGRLLTMHMASRLLKGNRASARSLLQGNRSQEERFYCKSSRQCYEHPSAVGPASMFCEDRCQERFAEPKAAGCLVDRNGRSLAICSTSFVGVWVLERSAKDCSFLYTLYKQAVGCRCSLKQ